MFLFEKYLLDHGIKSLDDPNLVSMWVDKARKFMEDAKDMEPDEITKADKALIEDFKEAHPEEVIEDPEYTQVKSDVKEMKKKMEQKEQEERLQNLRAQFEKDLDAATSAGDLDRIRKTYEAELPEVVERIEAALARQEEEKKKAEEKKAKEKKAEEKEKKKKPGVNQEVIDWFKKNHGKEVDYTKLEKMGIKPTGDDMSYGPVQLIRRYLFRIYTIDASGVKE